MMGSNCLKPADVTGSRQNFRLSCTAARDLVVGTVLSSKDICFRRPATGLPPKSIDLILGKALAVHKEKGSPFLASDFH